MRTALPLIATIVAVVLAACGGGDDPGAATDPGVAEEEVEQAAIDYGESEGAEACDFVSQDAIEQLGGQEGCEQTFDDVGSVELEIQSLEIEGDTATAQVRNVEAAQVFELRLVNEGGAWKVSRDPGLESIPAQESP